MYYVTPFVNEKYVQSALQLKCTVLLCKSDTHMLGTHSIAVSFIVSKMPTCFALFDEVSLCFVQTLLAC